MCWIVCDVRKIDLQYSNVSFFNFYKSQEWTRDLGNVLLNEKKTTNIIIAIRLFPFSSLRGMWPDPAWFLALVTHTRAKRVWLVVKQYLQVESPMYLVASEQDLLLSVTDKLEDIRKPMALSIAKSVVRDNEADAWSFIPGHNGDSHLVMAGLSPAAVILMHKRIEIAKALYRTIEQAESEDERIDRLCDAILENVGGAIWEQNHRGDPLEDIKRYKKTYSEEILYLREKVLHDALKDRQKTIRVLLLCLAPTKRGNNYNDVLHALKKIRMEDEEEFLTLVANSK